MYSAPQTWQPDPALSAYLDTVHCQLCGADDNDERLLLCDGACVCDCVEGRVSVGEGGCVCARRHARVEAARGSPLQPTFESARLSRSQDGVP